MNGSKLCAAHKKNGDPCGKYPIAGGSVCRFHGGAAPQVRAAAAKRLMQASRTAAEYLANQVDDEELDPTVRQRAAIDILNRTVGTRSQVEIDVEVKPWAQNIAGLLADTVEDVIEGEVLEIASAPAEVAPPRPARVREQGPPQYGLRPAEARRRGRPPS